MTKVLKNNTNTGNEITKNTNNYWKILVVIACVVYFTSYVTRYSYGVVKTNMIETGILTETTAGPIGSALFFAYGFGQIVSGILGDKFKPHYIIFFGMCLSTVCNLVFPFFNSQILYAVIWGINGFAQSMFWPPLVKILAEYLPGKRYSTACFWVLTACQIANIAMYIIVPLLLSVTGTWQSTFYFSAIFAGVATIVCSIGFLKIQTKLPKEGIASAKKSNVENSSQKPKLAPVLIGCGIITILISIALHGYLKDGITSWFPTCISNTFGLKSEQAILVSVVIPIISILGTYVITALYRKLFKNEIKGTIWFFGLATIFCIILYFFSDKTDIVSLIVTMILAALVVSLMHGINMMLISYVPSRFASMNCVSTVSGITNAFTYVGNTVSDSAIGLIESNFGFSVNVITWAGIALLGCITAIISYRPWTKFIKNIENQQNK